jgi:glycine/D-amino acid oxidase-like deaminating enzyme
MHANTPPTASLDAAIVGGGIAGAWALRLLQNKGYNAILLEADSIGCAQTLASQGMIHGGLKYALSGNVTGASEAIADMPRRWRACLDDADDVDLGGTRLLSSVYYMFAERTTLGRLTTFFASKALRGRIEKVASRDWPAEFDGFNGVMYSLNDFVMDTTDLLARLTRGLEHRIFQLTVGGDNLWSDAAGGYRLQLNDMTIHVKQLISCAGNGSKALLRAMAVDSIEMQQRPLKQVIVRPRHPVAMYAHCLTGITSNEPRLTITSHDSADGMIWYLGGQLATKGVDRTDPEQITAAIAELQTCVPWLDWQGAEYDILTVDRAEPKQNSGRKPDEAYVERAGDFIQCFPTKLTLAPDMGDRLLQLLDPPGAPAAFASTHPPARLGVAPW